MISRIRVGIVCGHRIKNLKDHNDRFLAIDMVILIGMCCWEGIPTGKA